MKKIFIAAIAVAPIACGSGWHEVTSEKGRFRVELPAPSEPWAYRLRTPGGELNFEGFGFAAGTRGRSIPLIRPPVLSATFADVSDIEAPLRARLVDEAAAAYEKRETETFRGRVESRRPFNSGGCAGVELDLEFESGSDRVRICAAGDRLYVLEVTGGWDLTGAYSRRFLGSFRVLPRLPTPLEKPSS